MSEILPCPMCGNSANFREDLQHGEVWGEWVRVLWCSSSHCRLQMKLPSDFANCRNRLIQMWNRRVVVNTGEAR